MQALCRIMPHFVPVATFYFKGYSFFCRNTYSLYLRGSQVRLILVYLYRQLWTSLSLALLLVILCPYFCSAQDGYSSDTVGATLLSEAPSTDEPVQSHRVLLYSKDDWHQATVPHRISYEGATERRASFGVQAIGRDGDTTLRRSFTTKADPVQCPSHRPTLKYCIQRLIAAENPTTRRTDSGIQPKRHCNIHPADEGTVER